MKIDIQASMLNKCLSAISSIIVETEIEFTKDSMKVLAMDPANIAMVLLELDKEEAISWEVKEPVKVAIQVPNTLKLLKRARSDDIIRLEMVDESHLLMIIDNRKKYKIPLLELNQDDTKVPNLEHKSNVELATKKFEELVDDCKIIAESAEFTVQKDKLVVKATSDNRIYHVNSEVKANDCRVEITGDNDSYSTKLSIEYLTKMVDKKLSDEVKISFADEYPALIEYKDQGLKVSYILAPRVTEDD